MIDSNREWNLDSDCNRIQSNQERNGEKLFDDDLWNDDDLWPMTYDIYSLFWRRTYQKITTNEWTDEWLFLPANTLLVTLTTYIIYRIYTYPVRPPHTGFKRAGERWNEVNGRKHPRRAFVLPARTWFMFLATIELERNQTSDWLIRKYMVWMNEGINGMGQSTTYASRPKLTLHLSCACPSYIPYYYILYYYDIYYSLPYIPGRKWPAQCTAYQSRTCQFFLIFCTALLMLDGMGWDLMWQVTW